MKKTIFQEKFTRIRVFKKYESCSIRQTDKVTPIHTKPFCRPITNNFNQKLKELIVRYILFYSCNSNHLSWDIGGGGGWSSVSLIATAGWFFLWLLRAGNRDPVLPPCGAHQALPDHFSKGQTPLLLLQLVPSVLIFSSIRPESPSTGPTGVTGPGLVDVYTIKNPIANCSIDWLIDWLID